MEQRVYKPAESRSVTLLLCVMQAEGQYEMLTLAEENVAVQVPVGAEFIQSPGMCHQSVMHIYTTRYSGGSQ